MNPPKILKAANPNSLDVLMKIVKKNNAKMPMMPKKEKSKVITKKKIIKKITKPINIPTKKLGKKK